MTKEEVTFSRIFFYHSVRPFGVIPGALFCHCAIAMKVTASVVTPGCIIREFRGPFCIIAMKKVILF